MEMKLMTALTIATALFLHHHSLTIAQHTTASTNSLAGGFSLPLFAKQGPGNTARRGTDGYLHLQRSLAASAANATAIGPEDGRVHITEIHFGTGNGRRKLILGLDSRAPMTWIQCLPCHPAATQTGPLFDGEASPTFRHVDSSVCRAPFIPDQATRWCLFRLRGPGGFIAKGLVSVDAYTREDGHVFPRFFFGCAHETWHFNNINTYAGLLAYRQFAAQAAAHGLARSSYCLFREPRRRGFLRFGAEADVPHSPRYQTTRILPPAHDAQESAYHVSLAGVSLGERRLAGVRPEMFARCEDGQGGGAIIDLGMPLTVLVHEAYRVVEDAVLSDLERQGAERVEQAGYGVCVRATEAIKRRLQPLSFHFAEEEATLVVSPKQLFLMVEDNRGGQLACLAMVPGRRTVIGAFQQVDTRFVFDLKENKLSFAPESCILDTVPDV